MCILLKLHYAKFGVSRLFCSKVIEEKPLGGRLDPPCFLLRGAGGAPQNDFCPIKFLKNNRKNNRNNGIVFCLPLNLFLAESQAYNIRGRYRWKVKSGVEMHNMHNFVNYCVPLKLGFYILAIP